MRPILCLAAMLALLPAASSIAQETIAREGYRVNPGDTLEISVWKEEDLQKEVLVRPDGAFAFPLAGEVRAEGRTVTDIREDLASRLSRYIPDLVITVSVVDVGGNRIFVIGQVEEAGSFVMNPRLDVMQALSLAGGTTPFAALKDIKILRRQGDQQTALSFDFTEVSRGRSLEQNILLKSGDVVVVP